MTIWTSCKLLASLRAGIVLAMLLCIASPSWASDWTGAGDGTSWNDPANWSDSAVPGPNDSATITDSAITVSSAVTIQNLTLTRSAILGNGNLTITGSLNVPDGGQFSGNGRLIIAPGATATAVSATQLNPLIIARRFDINGQATVSGPVTTTVSATVTVGAGANLSVSGIALTIRNNAVLTNNGVAALRSRNIGVLDSARIVNGGTMTIGGDEFIFMTANEGTGVKLSSTGPLNLGGAGGLTLYSRCEFLGQVNIVDGAVVINGTGLFVQPLVVAASAALTLHPIPANGFAINGNPAINAAGSVRFDGGVFPMTFPMAGSGAITIAGADLELGSDVVLNRPVVMRSEASVTPILRGAGVVTIAGEFNWIAGELQGAADFIVAPGGTLNVGSPVLQAGPNVTSRTIRNHGAMNIYTTGGNFGQLPSSAEVINDGVISVLDRATPFIPLRNLAGGLLQASAQPGTAGDTARWDGLVFNAGTVRVQAGGFGAVGWLGAPIDNTGLLQCDVGATFDLAATSYGPGSAVVGEGTFTFGGGHDLGAQFQSTGGFGVNSGAVVVLRRVLSPSPLLPIRGRLVLEADQVWSDVSIEASGALAGPGSLRVTHGLTVFSRIDAGGPVTIDPGATLTMVANRGIQISRSIVNWGNAEFQNCVLTLTGTSFDNRGQLTIRPGFQFSISSTGGVLNSGDLLFAGTQQGHSLLFPGPQGGGPGAAVPLTNSGTVRIGIGTIVFQGGGSSTAPFNVTAGASMEFNAGFAFASPVAFSGPGAVRFRYANFDCTNSQIANTGAIALGGTITLGHALSASQVEGVSGTITLLADQTWPRFASFGGTIRGPGNLTIGPNGPNANWSGGTFEGPGTVTFAAGGTGNVRTQSVTPLLVKTTLTNQGTFSPIRVRLDGGTLINDGALFLTDRIDAVNAGGTFTNNGTLGVGTAATLIPATPVPVQFRNNGNVWVTSGSLTIAQCLNYDQASNTLAGGTWTVEGTGVLTLTGADIRNIGSGATVSLVSSGATFAGLTNLTSNAGTLILGSGRAQNINPIGGTFTNSGELSLRAGSLFNVVGNFIQTAIGTLRTQIAGPSASQIGRLAATGSVTLGGTIVTEYANGYTPASCNATLPFISASSVTGSFASVATAPINGRVSRVVVGSSLAAVSVRNPADVATIGGLPPGDNALTADDVITFLNAFFSNNLAIADVAALGGALTPDGTITADDLIAFLNSFFAGCN